MSAQEQTGEPITQAGLDELKAELAELEGPARQKMAERIKRLQERLRNAVVVEVSELDSDVFSFGRTAEVLDESKGETNAWTLVGSTEANLAEGRLSAESPIGRALMDARVGATVTVETPKGNRSFKVIKLVS
jgi:transcription elongation factor GreA